MNLSENIRYLRSKKGLSQTALAESLGLKRGNISSYEKDLAQPSIQNLIKIGKYFEVDLESLVMRDLENASEVMEENLLDRFSHNKWVKGIKEGVQSLTHKGPRTEHIKKLREKNHDIKVILKGFRTFHKHRMENFELKESSVKSLDQDYQNILELLNTLLKSNEELISMADQ